MLVITASNTQWLICSAGDDNKEQGRDMADSPRLRLPPLNASKSVIHTANKVAAGEVSTSNDQIERRNAKQVLTLAPNFNVNRFATKKTITQGMLDVALLMSNVSQLKILIDTGPSYYYYTFMMIMVSLSILLQVICGCLFLYISITDLNKEENHPLIDRLNDAVTVGVFFITLVNVFIGVFGIQLGRPSFHSKEL